VDEDGDAAAAAVGASSMAEVEGEAEAAARGTSDGTDGEAKLGGGEWLGTDAGGGVGLCRAAMLR
jgi:hypothetical protein